MTKQAAQSAALLGISLLHASLAMAILLQQCFGELEPARLPMSQLLTPVLPPAILILLLSSSATYVASSLVLICTMLWQIGYLIWTAKALDGTGILSSLPMIVAQILIGMQIVVAGSILYLLLQVFEVTVYQRFATTRVAKTKTPFVPRIYWFALVVLTILLQLRLGLASWFPELNTHLLLFFVIMSPAILVHALLKEKKSLFGIQVLLWLLLCGELLYCFQAAFYWIALWPSAAAIALSAGFMLINLLSVWNLEMMKHVPFANRLAQLLD